MFQIFLDDKINNKYTELDCEDIDFTTLFAVADINEISARKDTITKDLELKGTVTNNIAFGYCFMFNKDIDESLITQTIGYNYNPQVLVDCYIYENGIQVLKGSLRLKELTIDGNGSVVYKCVITGDIIDFNSMIGDKELSDLDVSDLTHTLDWSAIQHSWTGSTVYTYPLINYGHPFKSPDSTKSDKNNPINFKNFKPALYVGEIMDRIFENTGFNYEIKGSEAFLNYFDSLFIPDNQDIFYNNYTYTGGTRSLSLVKTTAEDTNEARTGTESNERVVHLRLDTVTDTLDLITVGADFATIDSPSGLRRPNKVFNIDKDFKTSGKLDFEFDYFNQNPDSKPIVAKVQLLERDVISSSSADYYTTDNWDVIAETTIPTPYTGGSTVVKSGTLNISEKEFKEGRQFSIRFMLVIQNATGSEFLSTNYNFSMYQTDLLFPANENNSLKVGLKYGDTVTPILPTGIKQIEFLQSIRNLFNFYIYHIQDTKTIVFEQYDDYYSKCSGLELKNTALDWSNKIDRSKNIKASSNLSIPKNYNFKFKYDNDYINDYYQKKYNKSYGDYTVTDSKGITDKKEVNVIFSPTPLVSTAPSVNGANVFSLSIPYIYKVDSGEIAPMQSNIRILSFSGVQNEPIFISDEGLIGSNWYVENGFFSTFSPINGNFYISGGTALCDLHFGNPTEVFYQDGIDIELAQNSFSNYRNQIKELQNPNVTYVECEAYLNEEDISNLDLSVPIFIDLGSIGHSYWKVLKVDYTNSNSTSTVQLQKVIYVEPYSCREYQVGNLSGIPQILYYTDCSGVNHTVNIAGHDGLTVFASKEPTGTAGLLIIPL